MIRVEFQIYLLVISLNSNRLFALNANSLVIEYLRRNVFFQLFTPAIYILMYVNTFVNASMFV